MSPQLRASAEQWLDALKQAFWELDRAQRTARDYVDAFRTNLPDRVERSGMVPRFRTLDAETLALVEEYLQVIDRHPDLSVLAEQPMWAAAQAFSQLHPRLVEKTQQLDQFLADYDAELQRVAARVQQVEGLQASAERALVLAHEIWQQLRDDGFESLATDTALAKARVAGRGAAAWQPSSGVPKLEEAVQLVEGFADELRSTASEFPNKVSKLQTRMPSLRTRLAAITHRSERMEDYLGTLRREFSLPNWHDLEQASDGVPGQLAEVERGLDRLQSLLGEGAWAVALTELATVEQQLDEVDDAVDGPRERLELVRSLRAEPSARLDRARFAVKDAQVMVVTGRVRDTADLERRLDALAFRLSGVAPMLEAAHPDYLAYVRSIEAIEADVRQVVVDYRTRAGRGAT